MAQATLTTPAPSTATIASRLRRLRGRIALWFVIDGLSRVLLAVLVLIGADLLLDWTFEMDRVQRVIVLGLCVVALGAVVYRRLVKPLSYRLSDDALCLEVEEHNSELGEGLISALQFSRMDDFESRGVSPVLVRATIDDGLRRAEQADFDRVLRSDRFRMNVMLLAAALLGLAGVGVAVANTEPMAIWFNRNIALGDAQWPQDTYLVVEGAEDGTLVIPRGDDWPLVVTVREDSVVVPDEVFVEFRTSGGLRSEAMEKQPEGATFRHTLKSVLNEFELRARSRSGRTEWIPVKLIDRPAVDDLELSVTAPKYAGGRTETLPKGMGPYYVLKGSRLRLSGVSTKPLSAAVLAIGETRHEMALDGETGFRIELPPEKLAAGTYEVHLTDTERVRLPGSEAPGPLESKRPTRFSIRAREDRPPRLTVKLSGISGMVVSRAKLPCRVEIADDFAVTAARLDYSWKQTDEGAGAPTTGTIPLDELLEERLGGSALQFDYVFDLDPLKIPAGSVLSFRFKADDNDDVSGPNTGESSEVPLRVVGEDELRADLLRREKEQRQEFERLLKHQEDILTETRAMHAGFRGQAALPAAQIVELQKMQKRQKVIGTNVAGIAGRLASIQLEKQNNGLADDALLDPNASNRRSLNWIVEQMRILADEPIPEASRRLDQARRLAETAAERDRALDEASGIQDKIATTMREILRHMVKAESFQEAVNLAYEILRSQQDVLKLTEKQRQDLIRDILRKGGSKPEPKDPDDGN